MSDDEAAELRRLAGLLAPLPNSTCRCGHCRLMRAVPALLAERDRLRAALEELIEMVPDKCDDPKHPAWCTAHQQKRCHGEEVVARARAALKESA